MSGTSIRCIEARVSGRVQGVGFRMAACSKAKETGVFGYARNCSNGEVEVFACGGREAIQELIDWLGDGPPAARVDEVRVEDIAVPDDPPDTFDIF